MEKIAQTINHDFRSFFTNLIKKEFDIKLEFRIGVSQEKKQIITQYNEKR